MFEAILDKKLNAGRGFIKPKRKPPEELERLKRENFERAAPGLENPDEVKQMLGLAYGGIATPKRGLVDGPGSYSQPGDWKKRYKIKAFDEVADLFLKTYAEDDIDHIYKVADKLDDKIRFVAKEQELLDYVSKQSGLSENQIFNMLDDKTAHANLMHELKTQEGRAKFDKPVKDLDNRMRNWLMKNSKKYADPDRFKKSFNRVFGKNNYISKAIRMDKSSAAMVGFVDDEFVKTYISDKVKDPKSFSFSSRQLDDMFKTLIYNNNENVRNKVVKTFEDILPKEKIQKAGAKNVYNAIKNNKFLQKFNLDKGINGPVARLIAKNLDEKLIKQIDLYKKPYFGTRELLNYLGDHVDPQYKSMFKEAEQAVTAMQNDGWSKARKHLDTGREIMFDHKIPSSLIEAGYADEIEYIKLNPTSKEFNVNIKARTFDRPMNTLVRQFEQAKTLDEKKKIHKKMVAKKDAFSKKYGNYLDEVKIILDEKGKLKFTSNAPVVTKQTDLTKMLKTSLEQQKFPTMNNKQKINFLKKMGIKPTDTKSTILSKIKNAPLPNKLKGVLLGTLGGYGSITGADFLKKTGILFDKEYEPTASAVDSPIVEKGLSTGEKAAIGTGAALGIGTKTGRSLLGKAFRTLGTPIVAPAFAATNVAAKMGEGQSFADAVVDPITGLELSFPGLFKENISKITKSPTLQKILGLGRVGRMLTPVGLGLAALGQGQEFYNQYQDLQKMKRDDPDAYQQFRSQRVGPALTEEDYEDIYSDVQGAAGGGIVGIRRPNAIPPEKGPQSQGLDYLRYYGT